jgi:hypothetical protein
LAAWAQEWKRRWPSNQQAYTQGCEYCCMRGPNVVHMKT